MKTKTNIKSFLLIVLFLISINYSAYSQCIPGDSISCPDPENNGQVCPDTLPSATAGELYSEVATIKPPYTVGDSIVLDLHHIQLMDVGNLPDGITWVSNEPNNEFMAGEYYCILLEGTPTTTGTYYLKIIVDAYVIVIPGSPPVNVGQTIDSTSLFITVTDPFGTPEHKNQFYMMNAHPNPFESTTTLSFYSTESVRVIFELYNMLGERIFHKYHPVKTGKNKIQVSGKKLNNGTYYYVLRSGNHYVSGKIIRHQ